MALVQPSFVGCTTPGGGGAVTSNVLVHDFSLPLRIPGGADGRSLFVGDVSLASAALVPDKDGTLRGASIKLDTAVGAARSWTLEVLIDGAVVESLPVLSTGDDEKFAVNFSTTYVAGADIELFLRRTTGSGPSAFRRATATLSIEES